jgi:hypothetical protein
MSDLLLRTPRATPLEYEDVDANFENLNADKLQRTSTAGVTGTITTSASTSTITGLSSNNLAVGMVVVKTAGTGVLGTASTITAVDQFNDTITVVGSTSHTLGSITFTASPALNNAYINALSIGATTPGTGAFTTLSASGNASVTGNLTIDTNTLFVDATNNRVGIGTVSPSSKLHLYDATFNEILVQGDATTSIIAARYSTDASNPALALRKSRGTTASPTAVDSSDTLGQLIFQGYGGTNTRNLASIQGSVGTYTSDTNITSFLTFATSTSGAAAATEKMRIAANGDIGIGNTPSGTYKLEVTGNGYFSTALTVNTDLTVNGNTTLGNASGDTLTFNASTVSTPNGLNFDSNTLVIDATNNRIGVGVASPSYPLDVAGTLNIAPSNSSGEQLGIRLYDAGLSSGEGLNITWESANRVDMASINGLGDAAGGKLQFFTNGASSGTATLATEIDQDGYMWNYAGTLGTRGAKSIVPGYRYYRLNGNLAGGNDAATRAIFGVGVSLVANTIYEFEIMANFRKTVGATAHQFRFAHGGTIGINNILYTVLSGGVAITPNTIDAAGSNATIDTAALTTVTDSIGNANLSIGIFVKGTISVSTAGTWTPQYALTAAPGGAYSTLAGSYVKITPIGASGANTNIGSWA